MEGCVERARREFGQPGEGDVTLDPGDP